MRENIKKVLNWSKKYTKTDMIYMARGGFWITGSTAILALISIATMAAFANWIDPESYGIYQFVISTVGIIAILGLPGINTAIIRAVASGKEVVFHYATNAKFRWSLLGSLALLGVSLWYLVNQNFLLSGAFLISSMLFPLRHTLVAFETYWHGRKRFDKKSIFKVLSAIGAGATTIIALFLTDNILLIIFAFFAGHAFFDGIFFIYTKMRAKKEEDPEANKEAVSYGKHLTVMQGVGVIASHIDKIILWKFLGPLQVAIYSFAQLPIQKIKAMVPISALALPKFSENGVAWRKDAILYKTAILFILTIPIAFLLMLIAPFLYQIIFPQYMSSVPYFQVLAAVIALLPFTLLETGLEAERAQKALYIIRISSPAVKILLFLILGFFYGIWGIIFSIIIAEILRGALLVYFFLKM